MDTELQGQAAGIILSGFNELYEEYLEVSRRAKRHFEDKNWAELAKAHRANLDLYDKKETYTAERIKNLDPRVYDPELWTGIKRAYIALLYDHLRPELAETFFNSVVGKVHGRRNHPNSYYFLRPSVASEHIEGTQRTYRCYYPNLSGLDDALSRILTDFELKVPFSDVKRCAGNLKAAFEEWIPGIGRPQKLESNFHFQILSSLLYRDQTAHLVGRVCNGYQRDLFVIPLRHSDRGGIQVDAFIRDREDLAFFFSSSHSYFMAEMEVPSSWISFLNTGLVDRRKAELYTALGLQKQGKTLFVRDLSQHLKHSADHFVVAPGMRGMVMFVFTLPSFPFVFKVIRDRFMAPKETTPEEVISKYRLVKNHNRVGRLSDTYEFFDLRLPLDRFSPEVLREMEELIPSKLTRTGDEVTIRHLYIEERLTPLDLFIRNCADGAEEEKLRRVLDEFGQALKDLAASNIFPGDLLLKNFGVSNTGHVVFYDFDEIMYLTECNFRELPQASSHDDEMRAEPWFYVGTHDIFPEELPRFLFPEEGLRAKFQGIHPTLFSHGFWVATQGQVREGRVPNVLSYPSRLRFPSD